MALQIKNLSVEKTNLKSFLIKKEEEKLLFIKKEEEAKKRIKDQDEYIQGLKEEQIELKTDAELEKKKKKGFAVKAAGFQSILDQLIAKK